MSVGWRARLAVSSRFRCITVRDLKFLKKIALQRLWQPRNVRPRPYGEGMSSLLASVRASALDRVAAP